MSTKTNLVLTAIIVVFIIVLSFISSRLTVGFIIIGASFLGLLYNEWLIRQVGTIGWAERHIRSEGGTRMLLKLIAIFALVMGLLTVTGLHVRFIQWVLGPLMKYNQMGPQG